MSDWEHQPDRRAVGADIIKLFITCVLVMVTQHPFITLAFASIIPAMMGSWTGDIEYFIMGYVVDLILIFILILLVLLSVKLGGRRTT